MQLKAQNLPFIIHYSTGCPPVATVTASAFRIRDANLFFLPKDIREFTPYIVVEDAQIIPIFMPSDEDMGVSPRPAG